MGQKPCLIDGRRSKLAMKVHYAVLGILKIIYIKCPQALSVEEPVKSLCVAFNKRSHTQPLQTQRNLEFMDYVTITKILQKMDGVILKNNVKRKSRL